MIINLNYFEEIKKSMLRNIILGAVKLSTNKAASLSRYYSSNVMIRLPLNKENLSQHQIKYFSSSSNSESKDEALELVEAKVF